MYQPEPVVSEGLRRKMELAVSYDNIREHKKSSDFGNPKQNRMRNHVVLLVASGIERRKV
jgi:hypothetical protein